jgi:hypothetical protein
MKGGRQEFSSTQANLIALSGTGMVSGTEFQAGDVFRIERDTASVQSGDATFLLTLPA